MNLEDTPLYEMYEGDTTSVEGGFVGSTENDEDSAMATVLDREVQMPEVNDDYVNASVMLPRGNNDYRGKVI